LYGPVRVPDEAGLGVAKLTMSFDDWKEGKVAPATVEMQVVDAEAKKSAKP